MSNKGLYQIVIVFLFSQSTLFSQTQLGILGGVNISKYRITVLGEDYSPAARADFFAGLCVHYALNQKIALSTDLHYSRKGEKYEGGPAHLFNYIEFLPHIEYRILPYLGIRGGTYFAFKLNEKVKFDGSDGWQDPYMNLELIKDFDFGLSLGMSGNFNRLKIFADYQHGLKNLFSVNFTDDNGELLEGKNLLRNFRIGIAYHFLDTTN